MSRPSWTTFCFRDLCDLHTSWTATLLVWFGFNTNEEKSERTPRQSIIYLGFLLNFQTLSLALPPAQVANVATQCDRLVASETVTHRQLEAVVGLLNFAGPMLHLGRLFITQIIIWMNSFTTTSRRNFPILVTVSLREALLPFRDVKFLAKPTFHRLVSSLDILTDTTDSGCKISGLLLIILTTLT